MAHSCRASGSLAEFTIGLADRPVEGPLDLLGYQGELALGNEFSLGQALASPDTGPQEPIGEAVVRFGSLR
jgi:hypothetical protein